MLYVVVLVAICLINLSLGILVLMRNPRAHSGRAFFAFCLSVCIWVVANYLTDLDSVSPVVNDIANRLVYFFGLLAVLIAYWFSVTFPRVRQVNRLERYAAGAAALVLGILSLTSLTVGTVTRHDHSVTFTTGALLPVYTLGLTLFFALTIKELMGGLKADRPEEKSQIHLVLLGLTAAVVPAIVTNAVLPTLTSNWQSAKLGPLFTVVLVGSIAYAIARHRLFDIRLIIARFVAYILVLSLLVILYTTFIIAISQLLPPGNNTILQERVLFIMAAMVAAVVFPYAKRFFDRLTNQLFYQDAYEPQAFLDQLNKTLVSNIELEKLLDASAQIISDNLKAEYCLFGIKETGFKSVRIIGTHKRSFSAKDIEVVRAITPHLATNVIITDYLPPEADEFRRILQRNDVAVLVRLVPEFASTQDGVEGLGYIILGQKRSGNMYNSQDVKILGIVANELVIAVQNVLHFEEIQRFNITLQERIDKATYQLRRTNKKLEEMDETKDDFISMASHQLRTPLTSVKGYLSMVIEGDAGKLSSSQEKMLTQAFISAQRMVYLITDLLNVSRLKTGKFVIDATPVDLSKVIGEEVSQLREAADVRHIELTYTKPDVTTRLMLDETKTRQIIMNFIDNALYYTHSGGHIHVALRETPTTVELRVTDDGIGVPKSEQHHLFTKFYRAANARRARPDGTGLGLFMSKKVVMAQGGSIIFDSKEGKGSTFGFIFSKSRLKVPEHNQTTVNLKTPNPASKAQEPGQHRVPVDKH